MWGLKKQNTMFAIGKSILYRSSKTNVGELFLSYGGVQMVTGTRQVENDQADSVLQELSSNITTDS